MGDIVIFKSVYRMDLNDLIARRNYSKYMIIIKIMYDLKPRAACQVMCANGEINWVSIDRIERAN